jgi:flagellar basal-body rod modification protein FlgD
MQVDSTSPTTSIASTQPAAAQSSAPTVDYDAFLKLLIAELKNQDPTKPVDSAQYIAQLASFSNVEQGVKMNAKLDALMTSFNLAQAEGMIGRTVVSADGTVSGQVLAVRVTSDGPVALLDNGQQIAIGAGVTIA